MTFSHPGVYPNPGIRKDGLKKYLNRTKGDHQKLGYTEFVTLVTSEVNISNLARAFSVSRNTVRKWVEIYHEEKSADTTK